MKRILCIILSILMLLSLAACGEPEPDPEQLAFEAACALLEEGKYQEAIDAFSRLESYRKVQSKIYEAEAALEAQWLASEEAAKQAELEKLGFLYGTTWHELGGTLEVTFDALMDGFFGELRYSYQRDRETVDENDGVWYFQDGNIWIGHLPGLDWEGAEELGHKAKTEERDGITHLLIGDLDFVRSEDYGAFAPVEIEITLDNWQEYFEIREGYKWEQDDFGVTVGLRIITAIVLREEYRDRTVLDLTDVTFGSGLTTIGESSFYGCTGLVALIIPDSVTTIKGYAFKGCTWLTLVQLGSGLTTIGESAFHTCTKLKTLTIPAAVQTIGDYCFSGSYNLWKLTFEGSAPAIGTGAFKSMAATAYYPAGDATWTSANQLNYGGKVTWKAQ
jgi:hypothetical protein